jgi:predicted membrane-bound dolichyl-phosphate-mannose-protein mannosyltransferase
VFGLFWLIRRGGWLFSSTPVGLHHFFVRVFAALTPPFATAFWGGLTAATTSLAQRSRTLYTGNGQTYSLYILYYFLVLYIAGGGVR